MSKSFRTYSIIVFTIILLILFYILFIFKKLRSEKSYVVITKYSRGNIVMKDLQSR